MSPNTTQQNSVYTMYSLSCHLLIKAVLILEEILGINKSTDTIIHSSNKYLFNDQCISEVTLEVFFHDIPLPFYVQTLNDLIFCSFELLCSTVF